MASYSYFGNTSNRVSNLLYNFETQLLIFDELFSNVEDDTLWSNNSVLQIRYLEQLKHHELLKTTTTTSLGTKDARVKSAPLEDYGLIKRKEKRITKQGYEFLDLIKSESFRLENNFLHIDLISLFFIKASFNVKDGLFSKYLQVFRAFNGILDNKIFYFLPLIGNFSNIEQFIQFAKEDSIVRNILVKDMTYLHNLRIFINDLSQNTLRLDYFKSAKGEESAQCILEVLQNVFLFYRSENDLNILQVFLSSYTTVYIRFKKLYLKYITTSRKQEEQCRELQNFCSGSLEDFGKRFFEMIFASRFKSNLKDYFDLNRRYLKLTGVFEFEDNRVQLHPMFKAILLHPQYQIILNKIVGSPITQDLLNEYSRDLKIQQILHSCCGITNTSNLKEWNKKRKQQRLKNLIQTKFTKETIIELIGLFEDRRNDEKIHAYVSYDAKIPTIFEYIIAIAWYYIDNKNIDRILEAGLSFDSDLLPKSHALGGNADFTYCYDNHALMIEVTLTEKTNQRRAEMESVSRHLGNLLLQNKILANNSYALFIAPYLDRNVLNDFRSRLNCYYENSNDFVKGMKILPLSTQDLIAILKSNYSYCMLTPIFNQLLNSKDDWGSRWYKQEVSSCIQNLLER